MIGLVGRALYPAELSTAAEAENVFIYMSRGLLPAALAGLAMAGILAATISSSDSYLLIAASAFAKNMYQGIFRKSATDKQVMRLSRAILLIITAVAAVIALDKNSVIFTIVSFAWAGFGATFGPLVLFSLLEAHDALRSHSRHACWRSHGIHMEAFDKAHRRRVRHIRAFARVHSIKRIHNSGIAAFPEPSEEIQQEFDRVKAGE